MRVSYDRESDALMMEMSDEPIIHAEEAGPVIVHFGKDNRPILLEVLDASEVLTGLLRITMRASSDAVAELAV